MPDPPRDVVRERRSYNSPVRRQRTAATRERIVSAGMELLHGSPIWDWSAITTPAVAAQADVSERTVYRHFGSERALREALMGRLEEECGVELDELRLEQIAAATARIFEYVSSFPVGPRVHRDPIAEAASERQRRSLLTAVAPFTGSWGEADTRTAAAVLQVLWNIHAYERLVMDWGLEPEQAVDGMTWVVRLVERAIREGERPSSGPSA